MKKIGIAMSGGGMSAAVHLGVLKALNEYGIYPEIFSGTSMGSIIAGMNASGVSVNEIISTFYSVNKSILDPDIWGMTKSIFTGHVPTGIFKGNKIEKLLNDITKNVNVIDIKNKIAIVASDLNGEKNIIFTNSELTDNEERTYIKDIKLSKAIRASLSFPFAFKPVFYNDMILVDGGVVNNCPAGLCQEMGADIVIVSNIMPYKDKRMENNHTLTIANKLTNLIIKEASDDDINFLTVPTIRIPFFSLQQVPLLSISKENVNNSIIAGYEDTCLLLDSIDLNILK